MFFQPAITPPTFTSVAFVAPTYEPGDGGGDFSVSYAIDNAVGGEYVDLEWNVSAGDPITTTGGGNTNGNTTSPIVTTVALGANARASATARLYSSGAVLLDTEVLADQILPL